jgi:hypothetical protein
MATWKERYLELKKNGISIDVRGVRPVIVRGQSAWTRDRDGSEFMNEHDAIEYAEKYLVGQK